MRTRKMTRSGLLIALGVIIPYLFHTFGISGRIFLPMHFPPLLAGFLVGPVYAAIVGAVLPLMNSMISGIPQMPVLAFMTFELAAFGLFAGLLYRKFNLFISLILAMLGGRIIYFILFAYFIEFTNPVAYIAAGIASSLPGVIGQLLLIPAIVSVLETKYGKNIR
ncbi:MAG: ECF transporter S component [Bacillota bacterium]